MTDEFKEPFAVVASPQGDAHFVYCRDGSVWRRLVANGKWEELPPMPLSLRAAERDISVAVSAVPLMSTPPL
jgi:hypothetical protein